LPGLYDIFVKNVKIVENARRNCGMGFMGFSSKLRKKWVIRQRIWVFTVDFCRVLERITESFESGNTGVCGRFP